MKANTHLEISADLCGRAIHLAPDAATVTLDLVASMRADDKGLVHGGFVFGAADYAAMLAVNDPLVVLAAAEVKFTRPSRVGETLRFEARVAEREGKRRTVSVTGTNEAGELVFEGRFSCAVPVRHVLER